MEEDLVQEEFYGRASEYTMIEKCYNKGEVIEGRYCGGIVGISKIEQKKSEVNTSCNIGIVNSSKTCVGGICGFNEQYNIVKDNYILQGLEIKRGETQATREIGTSSSYLGKYVGQAYSTSTSYISGNGEITNEVNAENGDITDTVYYIVNGMNEGESEYWAKDDVTEPSLKWEIE